MYPKEEKVDGTMEVVYNIDEQGNRKSTGFDALGTSMMTSTDDQRGIWDIDVRAPQQNLLNEMNDGSMFYNDQFPHIPDFPCMSSSSSSSSNPAPAKPISSATTRSSASSASSSTSSAQSSWAVLKSEYTTEEEGGGGGDREDRLGELRINRKKRSLMGEEGEKVAVMSTTTAAPLETTDGSGTIDCACMDVMENFGYMDLIDGNDIWDPSSIFEQDPVDMQQEEQGCFTHGNSNRSEVVQESDQEEGGDEGKLDELGTMFFDWLKSNKEFISAEDMKNIKLKKSTVERASKRLGSSKEGKKQLLKLILEWVQQHQLQRKNSGCGELLTTAAPATTTPQYPLSHFPSLPAPPPQTQPPPFNCSSWVPPSDINQGFSPSTFIPPVGPYSQYLCNADIPSNGMAMVALPPPSTFSFMGGDYSSRLNGDISHYGNPGSGEYQVLESAPSWNHSQVTMASSPYNNNNNNNQLPDVGNTFAPQMIMPLVSGYPDQFPYNPTVYAGDEQNVMRLGSSATKEARKKRMARQRRTYFQHHHHSRQNQHNHHNHVTISDHQTHTMLIDNDNCSGKSHGGNWMYWPSPHSTTTVVPPPPIMDTPQLQSSRPPQSGEHQFKSASSDKRQGLKTEKNLKFLLQKVLKQSDVGSLGRIVLPKKEAESHLPDLDSRDGISIAMEDIGTSQVWNMRYRFWPNNKSRMYLLENTGDFVKANGLQEGDFIVLYSDVKCGKYLIRGVKVRQPAAGKSESKKPVKRSYRGNSQSARSSPSSPAKIPGF